MKSQLTKSYFTPHLSRKEFFIASGTFLTAAGVLASSSCSKGHSEKSLNIYDAGSGDRGLLNFLYANEQLQSAFYIAVFTRPYPGMSGDELKYMNDIHDHDIIHRDFFQEFLGNTSYPALTADFSTVDFSNRSTVLTTARLLKNNSIAAYNSVASLFKTPDYLTAIGKIVSVEGRHASTIASLISYGNILDNDAIDPSTSLEISKSPADILNVLNSYLKTKITANNLSIL